MHYVGLDLHERTSSICILNEDGRIVHRKRIDGHPRKVTAFLQTIESPFRICFEASTNYGWLYDALRKLTDHVLVAHPGRLRLIFKSRRKNDRLDASRLAEESGCGVVIDPQAVPLADAARRLAETSGRAPLQHALGDGEDFELILAVPPEDAQQMLAEQPLAVPLTHVGEFIVEPGLWQQEGDQRTRLPPLGYEH